MASADLEKYLAVSREANRRRPAIVGIEISWQGRRPLLGVDREEGWEYWRVDGPPFGL